MSILHVSGRPLVLFNIWDAGTAKVVASVGARALAIGSWLVAANGFVDGERISPSTISHGLSGQPTFR
jgi:2-methylisocitrate lyase-like PEP mutase family enzyme